MTRDIFVAPWWLDATAPGHWGKAEVVRGGTRLAELPYTLWRERLGFMRLGVGPFSPRMGPVFYLEGAKQATRIARENELVAELVATLPRYDYLSFTMPARVTNWLPFHWLGFHQTTRYSYVLDQIGNGQLAWGEMAEPTRRAIRKAQRQLGMADGDAGALMRLARSTSDRAGIRMRYGIEQLSAAESAARQRGVGAIRFAVDESGRAHAGAFFVWDSERLYYLIAGADTELRSSGGMSLVIWDGIKLAGSLGLRFDFEGSMIGPIERFFRGFGGTPEPYLHVTHTSRRLAAALSARELLQAAVGRRASDGRAAREPANAPRAGQAS